jgi:hypothetical protein
MTIKNGGTYIIVNYKTGTVIDLSGTDDGIAVSGWNSHGGDNQKVGSHLLTWQHKEPSAYLLYSGYSQRRMVATSSRTSFTGTI